LRQRLEAVRDVVRNTDLRRLELGWGAFFLVEWMTLVRLSVWAFEHDGADHGARQDFLDAIYESDAVFAAAMRVTDERRPAV
jgi:hypothetical protein